MCFSFQCNAFLDPKYAVLDENLPMRQEYLKLSLLESQCYMIYAVWQYIVEKLPLWVFEITLIVICLPCTAPLIQIYIFCWVWFLVKRKCLLVILSFTYIFSMCFNVFFCLARWILHRSTSEDDNIKEIIHPRQIHPFFC